MSSHTISAAEVKRLADLARLSITEEEVAFYQKDIEAILGFIDTIQEVSVSEGGLTSEGFAPVGYIRTDEVYTVPGGVSASVLIHAAPLHTDNAVKVKKILN
jgi:aspartyl-tRNA(Asn)/glutamyl-tRNA(Gln) amidotransferase subunit C